MSKQKNIKKAQSLEQAIWLLEVKSKKCCKFPLIQPIKLVRYLVKAFIPTTLD
ncbi:hypothetical protein SAMN02746069_02787, partial [Legionella israelensis DSM 19235]